MSNAMQDYLTQAAQRLRLSVDAQSGILFGNQGGMNMLLTRGTSNQNYVSLVFSLTRGGQEPDGAEQKSFVKGNKLVANCTVRRSRVEFILKARFGNMKDIDKLEQVTRETVSFLRSRGYQSCCQGCGQTVQTEACVMAGVPSLLCDSCYQQQDSMKEQARQEMERKPENVLAGIVGALLGSVLGAACIVLLEQLGYVAALSGIVLAICTLKGLKQAQKMQAELARAQEEIKDMTFEASAGGGMVKAVAQGDNSLVSLTIDPEAVDPEDVEMLQDMITAAVNEALRGVAELGAQRINAATGGMSIPGLM